MYVIGIMDQQVKWREGLSHLTFIMNEGREKEERERERQGKKNSSVLLSYFGIKFQPKGTENDLRKTELHPKTEIRSPSLWGWILPPGETLPTYKGPSVKASASVFTGGRPQTLSSAF